MVSSLWEYTAEQCIWKHDYSSTTLKQKAWRYHPSQQTVTYTLSRYTNKIMKWMYITINNHHVNEANSFKLMIQCMPSGPFSQQNSLVLQLGFFFSFIYYILLYILKVIKIPPLRCLLNPNYFKICDTAFQSSGLHFSDKLHHQR